MGYFRFMLALLVAYSHIPGKYMPINLGVSAVVAFYFISGHLMGLSYDRLRERSSRPVWAFYRDRFLKIFPAYWLVFIATLIVLAISGREVLRWQTLVEFLLLPYHLVYMFGSTNVLLPAWSLSAEIGFYLLLPLLVLCSTRSLLAIVTILAIGQLVVFSYAGSVADLLFGGNADACLGAFNKAFCERAVADLLGYRWLPFTLVYFAMGLLTYRLREKGMWVVAAFVAAIFAYLVGADAFENLKQGYVDEQLWGAIVLLIPALIILRTKDHEDRVNAFLGDLAYPHFLTHYFARHVVVELELGAWRGPLMVVIGLLAALAVAWFQKAVDGARYRVRGYGKTGPAGGGAIENG